MKCKSWGIGDVTLTSIRQRYYRSCGCCCADSDSAYSFTRRNTLILTLMTMSLLGDSVGVTSQILPTAVPITHEPECDYGS
jgi:hypothetical protein